MTKVSDYTDYDHIYASKAAEKWQTSLTTFEMTHKYFLFFVKGGQFECFRFHSSVRHKFFNIIDLFYKTKCIIHKY